ncbi:MAG: hypothetical protein IJ728_03205 [Selenomonadaceae bacterium]|nr:hypothetical protein [Selenomonadaceae bacterium]
MIERSKIIERIEYLKSISPAGADNELSQLLSAVEGYFKRDTDFEILVRRTILRVVSDFFSRSLIVEYPERLPELSTDYPPGYEDVTEIFGGEVFSEIITISDNEFRSAFQTETVSSGGATTTTYTNSYITKWISEMSAKAADETKALEKIGEFCIICNEERALALIFEELGRIEQPYNQKKRELARKIYLKRGYDWVIITFDLKVFEPHYLPELR